MFVCVILNSNRAEKQWLVFWLHWIACLVICHDNSVVFMAVGVVVWPPKVPCEVKSSQKTYNFFTRENVTQEVMILLFISQQQVENVYAIHISAYCVPPYLILSPLQQKTVVHLQKSSTINYQNRQPKNFYSKKK